jgi:hypothetical protein
MIPIREAVEKAVYFAMGVLEPARTGSILLEEGEANTVGGNAVWLITLSLPDPDLPLKLSGHRQYKTFTVDGQTGEVLAMKIRQLNGVT